MIKGAALSLGTAVAGGPSLTCDSSGCRPAPLPRGAPPAPLGFAIQMMLHCMEASQKSAFG